MTSSVYRPTRLFRYLLWGQACLSLIIPLFTTWILWTFLGARSGSIWQPLNSALILLLFLYIGVFLNFLYVRATLRRMRLELSSEGITFHQLGLHQFAPWEDVKALKQFLLRREIILSNVESRGTLSFIQNLAREKRFPLTPFVSDWYYSDLRKDLEHYAPQLFDNR